MGRFFVFALQERDRLRKSGRIRLLETESEGFSENLKVNWSKKVLCINTVYLIYRFLEFICILGWMKSAFCTLLNMDGLVLTSKELPVCPAGWILRTMCILIGSEIRFVWNSNEVLLLKICVTVSCRYMTRHDQFQSPTKTDVTSSAAICWGFAWTG